MSETSHQNIKLAVFPLGDFQTNCYVLHVEGSSDCWIIDAGQRPLLLINYVIDRQLAPQAIILTHAHGDHIHGLQQLRDRWPDAKVYLNSAEDDFLLDPAQNLSAFVGTPFTAAPATDQLNHGDVLTLSGVSFECRHVPGHSPGSMCLYQPEAKLLMAGDTLFDGSIGRTDFPHGDHATLLRCIDEQIMTLPDDTRVYPGHMGATTVGKERRTNPFLR